MLTSCRRLLSKAFGSSQSTRLKLTPIIATTLVLGSYYTLFYHYHQTHPHWPATISALFSTTNTSDSGSVQESMSSEFKPKVNTDVYVDTTSDTLGFQPVAVYVTVPNPETADRLSSGIVNEGLAACVNIVPGLVSVYTWKGEICKDQEQLLIIKTQNAKIKQLHEYIRVNHPYETPEFITLPIQGGSLEYLNWLRDATRKTEE